MEKKRMFGYFAVTLLALAVCVQIVTAAPAPTNAQLQTEITNLQTKMSGMQNTINSLTTANTNLNNKLTNLQTTVSAIKPGSQVVVETGIVGDGKTINVPTGYTTDQCNVLLGLGSDNMAASLYQTNILTYWYPTTGEIVMRSYLNTKLIPNSTKTGFVVNTNSEDYYTDGSNYKLSGEVGYMLIATK
jgi:hypothetical protein